MNQIQIFGTKDNGEIVIVSFPYASLEAAITDLQRRVVEFKWFIDKIIIEQFYRYQQVQVNYVKVDIVE